MKRSKIFIGVTTALLVVAGVTAARRYGPPTFRLYITHDLTACLPLGIYSCSQGGLIKCLAHTLSGNYVDLYTDGPAGRYNNSNPHNCTSQLRYSNEP